MIPTFVKAPSSQFLACRAQKSICLRVIRKSFPWKNPFLTSRTSVLFFNGRDMGIDVGIMTEKIILNDAVKNYSDLPGGVGMGIYVAGFTMSGPPGMTHPDGASGFLSPDIIFKVRDLPLLLVNGGIAVQQSYSRRVISPVFQSLQTFYQYRVCIPGSDIANNPTHGNMDLPY
jgi:hypothetical protein